LYNFKLINAEHIINSENYDLQKSSNENEENKKNKSSRELRKIAKQQKISHLQSIQKKLNSIKEDYKNFEYGKFGGTTHKPSGQKFLDINSNNINNNNNNNNNQDDIIINDENDKFNLKDIMKENFKEDYKIDIDININSKENKIPKTRVLKHSRSQSENLIIGKTSNNESNVKFSFLHSKESNENKHKEENKNKMGDFLNDNSNDNIKDKYKIGSSESSKSKISSQISISEILKRLSDKSKIEFDLKQRSFFNKIPHNYLNLENIGANNLNNIFNKNKKNNTIDEIELRQQKEIILLNNAKWQKHESAWDYLSKTNRSL